MNSKTSRNFFWRRLRGTATALLMDLHRSPHPVEAAYIGSVCVATDLVLQLPADLYAVDMFAAIEGDASGHFLNVAHAQEQRIQAQIYREKSPSIAFVLTETSQSDRQEEMA